MKGDKPIFFDNREYETEYVEALKAHGFQGTRMDFRWFNVKAGEMDLGIAVGDLAVGDRSGVIEVKTKEDLIGSFRSGRLAWQIWYAWILKQLGYVDGTAVLIRHIDRPFHDEHAIKSWRSARQLLAHRSKRYGFQTLIAEDAEDTCEMAMSYFRECSAPKAIEMPAPYIPGYLFNWPFAVQVLSLVPGIADEETGRRGPGIGIELAKQIVAAKDLYGMIVDTHDMDEDSYVSNYNDLYAFGGKEGKRLRAIYRSFKEIPAMPDEDTIKNFFYMEPWRRDGLK